MRIEFGIAGIPLSCKGRTILDGIIDTRRLGLDVMEIEMIRKTPMLNDFSKIRKTARENHVKLSIHAPYYMNITDGGNERDTYMEILKECGIMADRIGAKILVVHGGIYRKSREQSLKDVILFMRKIRNHFKTKKIKCKLGIETSGKQRLFGDVDEVVEVCKRVSGVQPIINFAHIHARGNGCLKTKDDFQAVFDKLKKLKLREYYIHFSGVEYKK